MNIFEETYRKEQEMEYQKREISRASYGEPLKPQRNEAMNTLTFPR